LIDRGRHADHGAEILGIPIDKLPAEMAAKILTGGSAVCASSR
jgi:hypothetical protein